MLNKKNSLAFLAVSLLGLAGCRTVEVTPGNQAQPACPVNSPLGKLTERGKVFLGGSYSTNLKKQTSLNKPLKAGDLIYYASFNDGEKYFTASHPIEIKDASPLNYQTRINPGEKIISQGVFFYSKTGQNYDLVRLTATQFFLVDERGFMCSTSYGAMPNLDSFLGRTAMVTVYQSQPLTPGVSEDTNSSKKDKKSIAISVSSIDGAKVALDVVYSINDKIAGTKTVNFSSQAKNADLNGFDISFSLIGNNAISVSSVSEPSNLSEFAKKMFRH